MTSPHLLLLLPDDLFSPHASIMSEKELRLLSHNLYSRVLHRIILLSFPWSVFLRQSPARRLAACVSAVCYNVTIVFNGTCSVIVTVWWRCGSGCNNNRITRFN